MQYQYLSMMWNTLLDYLWGDLFPISCRSFWFSLFRFMFSSFSELFSYKRNKKKNKPFFKCKKSQTKNNRILTKYMYYILHKKFINLLLNFKIICKNQYLTTTGNCLIFILKIKWYTCLTLLSSDLTFS